MSVAFVESFCLGFLQCSAVSGHYDYANGALWAAARRADEQQPGGVGG